jgi:hypothetical protein
MDLDSDTLRDITQNLSRIAVAQWIPLLYTDEEVATIIGELKTKHMDMQNAHGAFNQVADKLRESEAERARLVGVVELRQLDAAKHGAAVADVEAFDVKHEQDKREADGLWEEWQATQKTFKAALGEHPLIGELVTKGRYFLSVD